jgi:hypothetical protein
MAIGAANAVEAGRFGDLPRLARNIGWQNYLIGILLFLARIYPRSFTQWIAVLLTKIWII